MHKAMDFLSLPDNVLCDVLCRSLSLVDLVRLDSACCHRHNREVLTQLVRSKQFVLKNNTLEIWDERQLYWVCLKHIKCSVIELHYEVNFCELTKYLREHGDSVREVTMEGSTTAQAMVTIALYCKKITILRVVECILTSAFVDILWNNANLEELWCIRIVCAEPNLLAGLSMHKLRVYSVEEDLFQVGFPWSATTYSDSLHTVIWDCSAFTDDDLDTLTSNCPQLRSLSCDHVDRRYLGLIAPKLSNLYNLSIGGNITVTDAELLVVVQSITCLRTLNVSSCFSLTSQSLVHIADHAGDTLDTLYTDIKEPASAETERALEIFAQKCIKLKFLSINCRKTVLCSGKGTSFLIYGCPQLRTLMVCDQPTICATSREFIARVRPDLEIVEDDNYSFYCMLNMPVD